MVGIDGTEKERRNVIAEFDLVGKIKFKNLKSLRKTCWKY